MSVEGLYFLVGFLLGTMLTGCIFVACILIYYEWMQKSEDEE